MFRRASGRAASTMVKDFWPTVILSPNENPSRSAEASNLPSPLILTSPGTLLTRYALPSSSLRATQLGASVVAPVPDITNPCNGHLIQYLRLFIPLKIHFLRPLKGRY